MEFEISHFIVIARITERMCLGVFEIFDMNESKVMLGDGKIVDGGDDMAALNFICSSLKEGANHTCSKLLEQTRRRKLKKINLFILIVTF